MNKTNCSKCGTAIIGIGPTTTLAELCMLCGVDVDRTVSTDVTVPKSLLVECAMLATSYEAVARRAPYAGRDPEKEEPRDPQKAADLRRRIDEILEAARA